jgi:predicted O-methyltransferase YrrM
MPLSAHKIMELYKLSLFKKNEMVLPSIMGATSKKTIKARTIGKTARIISVHPSYGNMLFRMVSLHKPDLIIEMGTAFGISTAYMALAMPDVPVITMEGNNLFAEIARKQFAESKISNITLLNATFDDILPHMKINIDKRVFVFIDGNHTYAATLEYFDFFNSLSNQNLILIFDDINWSVEMVHAWKYIKRKATGYRAINLFRCGILIRGY